MTDAEMGSIVSTGTEVLVGMSSSTTTRQQNECSLALG